MALNKKSDGELLEEALLEIQRLKIEIEMLRNQQVYIPQDFNENLGDKCTDGGFHEYPNPWHSITPAHCKKCGKQAESYPITYSDNGTGNPPWDFNKHGGNVMNNEKPIITHDSETIYPTYISDTSGIF